MRVELETHLRSLRDELQDEGQLDAAAVVDCFAEVAQSIVWTHNPDRTARDLFLDAVREIEPCECDPCPECGKLGAPDRRCACSPCPHCGGRVECSHIASA